MVRAQAVAAPPTQPQHASVSNPPTKALGPIIMNGQVLHSITQERLDVVRSLEDGFLQKQVRRGWGGLRRPRAGDLGGMGPFAAENKSSGSWNPRPSTLHAAACNRVQVW